MEQFLIVYIIITLASLAVTYVLIRFGVQHGTRAALREHEMWMRDGSLDRAIDAHAARIVDRQEAAQYAQRVAERERN
ncbi:hypothetical protein DEU37_2900 [Microbacterium sp. AG790]|uniref:hypothetical protein n=1 Tax=Microbacterium sp. AG790 TaxID=2183995 RepID=UPI000EB15653|nr:hypothetical protein [Microbacterium sp. AG790]RKS84843.1 hypothetical protein DEU37_2900 [Microbacterium sp. AG790]